MHQLPWRSVVQGDVVTPSRAPEGGIDKPISARGEELFQGPIHSILTHSKNVVAASIKYPVSLLEFSFFQ